MIRNTLDSIIREYQVECDDVNPSSYARYVRIAKSGLKELNLDVASTPKVVELDVDRNTMVADLPADFINYKRIGMCIDCRIIPLGYNPNLCIGRTFDDCGNLTACGADTTRVDQSVAFTLPMTYPLHFRNGETLGAFFGVGGGNNSLGYYRIMEEHGQILFSSLIDAPVVLEYLADINKVGVDYEVHPYLVETLKAWLAWASIRMKKGVGSGEIQQKRFEYYNQRRLSCQRYSSFTLDEAYQYSRMAFKQAPKV